MFCIKFFNLKSLPYLKTYGKDKKQKIEMEVKMIVEKGSQGQWIITALVHGYLVSRQFFGYSKKEAVKRFKLMVKNNDTFRVI
jgi:hypothetical protein